MRNQRWAIVNFKAKKEVRSLGWFTGSTKGEVLDFCDRRKIKIEKKEALRMVEEY